MLNNHQNRLKNLIGAILICDGCFKFYIFMIPGMYNPVSVAGEIQILFLKVFLGADFYKTFPLKSKNKMFSLFSFSLSSQV
jgi:hypothetical protein